MPLPKAPNFEWSLGQSTKRIEAARTEILQAKITISVCGIEIGCLWMIFMDQASIDVLLQIDSLSPSDFYPFDSTENPKILLQKVVNKYCRKQIEMIHQYGVERVSYQLNDASQMDLYQVKLAGNRVLLNLPFECIVYQNKQSLGWIHFVFVLEERGESMVLASVDKITISWPELNSEPIIKAPDWSPEVSAREYALNFQLLVNQKQKKLMNARIMRQHFVLELEKLFKNFLLERDDDEFLFVSLYIMIATDDNILGAAVCNFHLNNYPEFAPKVYLTSPLFFESANSFKPASKEMVFDYHPSLSAVELCAKIKDLMLNQIVGLHSQLVHDISSHS